MSGKGGMSTGAKVASGVALAAALLVGANLTVLAPGEPGPVTDERFPELCQDQATPGQGKTRQETGPDGERKTVFPFGRWTVPSDNLSALDQHGSYLERFGKLKRWSYLSITSPELFLSLIPVKFGYVEDLYLSVVNRQNGRTVFKYKWQMPMGQSLEIASVSAGEQGSTKFDNSGWGLGESLELRFDAELGLWFLDIRVKELTASVKIHKGAQALALWYPLGGDVQRPAYIHKEAGMNAQGWIKVQPNAESSSKSYQDTFSAAQGAATLDWTKAFALRETKWNWVSMSVPNARISAGGRVETLATVGVNLSRNVYDVRNSQGYVVASAENALWIDGKVIPLNLAIHLKMPPCGKPLAEKWHISSTREGHAEIDLVFSPKGLHEDHAGHRALGIVSDFVQPHGTFFGTIKVKDPVSKEWIEVSFDDAYGVCEDHHAIW